ncbi:serine/threonine-protein kinase [Agrococcus sp. TF02-05]|uniref:serine/threonine-protein kinase n=1 Tax=Agrococcus sp. TF02-05 TaxID=2815211 RepID=UPI001AA10A00|nr:serine/threonine-protein kinase [Agrococcus sp. TF02-05]MBO1771007.1 serine/threonine protein kinase [Agrococcus sp. TF02-05]
MARRLPSAPPVLPGYSHLHVLGTGGYADVFLYEQALPRRPVAVKVLLAELVDEDVRRSFRTEVNLMGRLSSHPSILTVYGASVASDGRPYLVMELANPELGERFRTEPLAPEAALRVAIRIGAAVETAHRAGVLHRDIKPANILTTSFGHPVLSDFGIAGLQHDASEAAGVSVPWAAPEVLRGETGGTIATEVWSLAATLFSLIAGRSPAEQPGRANDHAALSERIIAHDLLPSRAIPAALRPVLDKALAARPGDRHASVEELLGELQRVQRELGFEVTPIEVEVDAWAAEPIVDDDVEEDSDALRLRQRRSRRAPGITGSRVDISQSTGRRQPPKPKRFVIGLGIAAASAVVLGIITVAAFALSSVSSQIPIVQDIAVSPEQGRVAFAWEDPGLVDTDTYHVRTSTGDAVIQGGREFTLTGAAGERLCIWVAVNRDGSTGEPSEACGEPLP